MPTSCKWPSPCASLGVESIPVNFLNPIDGTPLAGQQDLNPRYCLKVLAMFRFVNPTRELRIAGGREMHLGSLQPLGLVRGQQRLRRRLSDDQGAGARGRLPDDRRDGLRRSPRAKKQRAACSCGGHRNLDGSPHPRGRGHIARCANQF